MADKSTAKTSVDAEKFQLGMSSFNAKDRREFGQNIRLAMACIDGTAELAEPTNTPSMPTDAAAIRQRLNTLSHKMTSWHADLLELLVRFDEVRGWEASGARHCVAWMNFELGIGRKLGWEYLKAGRQLRTLPTTRALFRAGTLSWSKVRAIVRVANKETEQLICHAALDASVSDVEQLCKEYQWNKDNDEDSGKSDNERAAQQWASRSLYWRKTSNGSTRIELTLPPEIAQAFLNSVEHSLNILNESTSSDQVDKSSDKNTGNNNETIKTTGTSPPDDNISARRADAAILMAETSLQADIRDISAADRYQVIVSVEGDGLSATSTINNANNIDDSHKTKNNTREKTQSETKSKKQSEMKSKTQSETKSETRSETQSETQSKTQSKTQSETRTKTQEKESNGIPPKRPTIRHAGPIARETARRIACDCSITTNTVRNGEPTSVGRKSRLWPAAMARAIKDRDQHCQFYGCTQTRNLQIHHIKHWADGGTTSIENGVCLCQACHTKVHEGGYSIQRVDNNEQRLNEQFARQCLSVNRNKQSQEDQRQKDCTRNTSLEQQLRGNRESFNQVRALLPTTHRFRIVNTDGRDIRDYFQYESDKSNKVDGRGDNCEHFLNENSIRVDSTRVDSTRVDSTRLDSTRMDSTRMDSTCMDSTRVDSTRLDSTCLDTTRMDSTCEDSTRVDSTRLDSTHVNSTHVDSTHVDSTCEDSTCEDSTCEDSTHVDSTHVDSTHVDSTHVDSEHSNSIRVDSKYEDSTCEGSKHENSTREDSVLEGSTRVDSPPIDSTPVSSPQSVTTYAGSDSSGKCEKTDLSGSLVGSSTDIMNHPWFVSESAADYLVDKFVSEVDDEFVNFFEVNNQQLFSPIAVLPFNLSAQ